jgi:hypothetical protein
MSQELKKGGIAAATGVVAGLTATASFITLNIVKHSSNTIIKALGWIGVAATFGLVAIIGQKRDTLLHDPKSDQLLHSTPYSWGKSLALFSVFSGTALLVTKATVTKLTEAHNPLLNKVLGPIMLALIGISAITSIVRNNGNPQEVEQQEFSRLQKEYITRSPQPTPTGQAI